MSEIPDLLERFRRGTDLVAEAGAGADRSEWDWSPASGKWSIRQIMCHLADSELVGADRFRRVIAEENAVLQAYDQDAWADRLDYRTREFSQALESFRRLRMENYELLKGLPEDGFVRTGKHSERGTVTLKDLLLTYIEHAEAHARQIRGTRDAFTQSRATRK